MMTDEVHALSMRTYSPAEWDKMSAAEKAGQ
jgi:acid stress-induced BolA-like protein IbaG/YrbA